MKKYELFKPVYDNDLSALIPEVWAQEGLMELENQIVLAGTVYRNFSDELAQFGDIVNADLPADFVAARKGSNDPVVTQDAKTTRVPVAMNQHLHVSFVIHDGDESKSRQELISKFLRPAIYAVAQGMDEVIGGQFYDFLPNSVGRLGVGPGKQEVLAARAMLTNNKCPFEGRHFALSPDSEISVLNVVDFTSAEKIGDDGTAIREASLGRKLGFDFLTTQNVPSVPLGSTTKIGAINKTGGYNAGATVLTVDGFTSAPVVGSYLTVAGDDVPQRITAATTTSITIAPGLKSAVGDDAAITVIVPGAINNSGGYIKGYPKSLAVDGFTVDPFTGQLVAIGNNDPCSLMSVPSKTEILPSQVPMQTISDNDVVALGPAGNYNFAYHSNAIALVSRPLAAPIAGTGALSYVANYNGLALRVTITYDGEAQGHRVTVDTLLGVTTLDRRLGCVVLG